MEDGREVVCIDDDDLPSIPDVDMILEDLGIGLDLDGGFTERKHDNRQSAGSIQDPIVVLSSDDEEVRPASRRPRLKTDDDDNELLSLSSSDEDDGRYKFACDLKLKRKHTEGTFSTAKLKKAKRLKPGLSSSVFSRKEDCRTDNARTDSSVSPPTVICFSTSPSKKSPKKKKTLADIVTDVHETSTDEIDSDEIHASQEKLKVDPSPSKICYLPRQAIPDEPQPCCSKSLLPQSSSTGCGFNYNSPTKGDLGNRRSRFSSDEEELPDIDFYVLEGYRYTRTVYEPTIQPDPVQSCSTESSTQSSTVSGTAEITANPKPKKPLKKAQAESKRLEKEAKKLEREKKKAEEAKEKELKKMENELRKNSRPGEAVKSIILNLDELITEKLDALVPQLVAADLRYKSINSPLVENSITFQRELVHQAMDDNMQLQKVRTIQEENQIMIVLDSDKVIPMIESQLKRSDDNIQGVGIDFITWAESIKSITSGKKLTLFLYDMDKYFRKIKRATQQEFRTRLLNNDDDQPQPKKKNRNKKETIQISKTEVQSALIELQLQTGVNYRFVKDVVELGTSLVQYAKAIADAPFKKQRLESQGFDWFALLDSAGSVKVEKDGNGLRRLWIDQIQQFNSVGNDMASAVVKKYPSPTALIQAYDNCNNVEDGQNLLKDLTVVTGVGPLARTRKVGPELSKKMYRFFTSTNGDRFLGSTSDMR